MIIRKKPSYAVMCNLYDTIRELVKEDKFYYNSTDIEKIKQNKNNIFLQKGHVANE